MYSIREEKKKEGSEKIRDQREGAEHVHCLHGPHCPAGCVQLIGHSRVAEQLPVPRPPLVNPEKWFSILYA